MDRPVCGESFLGKRGILFFVLGKYMLSPFDLISVSDKYEIFKLDFKLTQLL